jgi:hypothetical protein
MTPEQSYSVISLLNDIKKLLEKQNELLDTVLTNGTTTTQTKITVVGNKTTTNTKGLNNTDDFTL